MGAEFFNKQLNKDTLATHQEGTIEINHGKPVYRFFVGFKFLNKCFVKRGPNGTGIVNSRKGRK